jgi:murein DD-endopeptidase MepM/ murein hydrolase activator NlpD
LSAFGFALLGVLLWSQTPAPAASYVRQMKNGVVYYYFSSREHPPPQPIMPAPPPQWAPSNQRARGTVPTTDPNPDLWPKLLKALNRVDSTPCSTAGLSPGTPDLTRLRLGLTDDLQADTFYANMWITPRFLGRLWAWVGSLKPRLAAACSSGYNPPVSPPDTSALQEAQVLVREARQHFFHVARPLQPDRNYAPMPNQFGYCFPVAYPFSFRDSWSDWRSGGLRLHRAVDIFAQEGTPVCAITAGVIQTLANLPDAGIMLLMLGQDQRGYGYMHLQGYAPGIVEGKRVQAGELIGYVGRTGIQDSQAHLHFQVYADHRLSRDELLNPYTFLVQLCQGRGVTDLNHHQVAQTSVNPGMPVIKPFQPIQVTRRPVPQVRASQIKVREPKILVIKNF